MLGRVFESRVLLVVKYRAALLQNHLHIFSGQRHAGENGTVQGQLTCCLFFFLPGFSPDFSRAMATVFLVALRHKSARDLLSGLESGARMPLGPPCLRQVPILYAQRSLRQLMSLTRLQGRRELPVHLGRGGCAVGEDAELQ